MIACHQCNLPVENGAKFCAACGTSINAGSFSPDERRQAGANGETAKAGDDPQSFVPQSSGLQHAKMMRSRGVSALVPILIAAAVGLPLLTIGGVVVALQAGWLQGSPSSDTKVEVTPTQNTPAPKEELTESMKKELKKLEEDRDDLEKQIRESKKKLEEHQDEIRKAETRIENMLSIQKKLETWQKASLVVGSQKLGAVAFTTGANKDELIYLDKADAELAAASILASTRRGAQWLATNEQFVQTFESEFEAGKPLRPENYQEIAKRLVRTRVLAEPALTNAPYVTYRLKTDMKPKFARYCGKTNSAIRLQHIGEKESTVEASLIAPGSARLISNEEIKHLDDGEFLDAALLGAIAKLQESVAKKQYAIAPKLAIDVLVTNGRLTKGSSGYVIGQLCRNSPGAVELDRAGYLLRADLYKRLVGIEKLDPGFSVAAPEKTDEFLLSAIQAKFCLVGWLSWNRSHTAASIVSKSAIKDWNKFMAERAVSDATHLLQVEIGPPAQSGEYFLNVQLHDLRDRTVVFADAGDRYFRARSNLHYPASGSLAMIKRKNGMFEADAVQEPDGLSRGSLFKAITKSSNALVLGESLSGGSFAYRTLLGTRLKYESEKDIEVEKVVGDYEKKVPIPDRIRLCAHQLIRASLPPSSIVTSVSDGDGATIRMGTKAGLKAGDRLAVARSLGLPNGESLVSDLDVPVIINEIAENTSKVTFIRTGLEDLFPRNVLEPGDTVYAQSRSVPIVVMPPFQFAGVADQKVAAKLKGGLPLQRQRLASQAKDAIELLHERLGVALRSLNIPTIDYRQFDSRSPAATVESIESYGSFLPPNAKVTRVVNGKVTVLSEDECQFEFFVTEPTTNQLLDRFPVTLRVGRD